MGDRNSMIETAYAWNGCNEADGSFKAILDVYNQHKPLARGYQIKTWDEWCATFVSACAIKSGNASIVPLEVSCYYMMKNAMSMGIWKEDDNYMPKKGDIVLYDWQDNGYGDNTGTPDHVGIVLDTNGTKFRVIEGNKNERVGIRDMNRNGKYIRGFIAPKYIETPHQAIHPNQSTTIDEKAAINYLAKQVIAGKHGTGGQRIQSLYDTVQTEVNKILKNQTGNSHVAALARAVIAGKYGNGNDRKTNIYKAVQSEVNRLLK